MRSNYESEIRKVARDVRAIDDAKIENDVRHSLNKLLDTLEAMARDVDRLNQGIPTTMR